MTDEQKEPSVKEQILDKMAALITAAFGLVAALAWNEAIKAIFAQIFGPADAVTPMVIYAIVVTIIAVILTILVARAVAKVRTVKN